jgi:hypothetical protein
MAEMFCDHGRSLVHCPKCKAATPAASEAHAIAADLKRLATKGCYENIRLTLREAAALIERLVAAEPDEAMVEAACVAHHKAWVDAEWPKDDQMPGGPRFAMRAALKAALTARKETP